MVDLERLCNSKLSTDPFDYFVVPGFVKQEFLDAISEDFPKIDKPGSFPLNHLTCGRTFTELIDELRGDAVRKAFEDKFNMDLTNRPTTLTVRGRTRLRDGKIHTDSKTKLITVLIYFNHQWQADGGRLRLLRSSNDLENYIEEIPPFAGHLVAFRCTSNAWHGHHPHEGERRCIQLNWVVDEKAAKASQRRHGWSAWLKTLSPF